MSLFDFHFGDTNYSGVSLDSGFCVQLGKAFINSIPALSVFIIGFIANRAYDRSKKRQANIALISTVHAHTIQIEKLALRMNQRFTLYAEERGSFPINTNPRYPWFTTSDIDRLLELSVDKTFEAFLKTHKLANRSELYRVIFNSVSDVKFLYNKIDEIHKILTGELYELNKNYELITTELFDLVASYARSNNVGLASIYNSEIIRYQTLLRENEPTIAFLEENLVVRIRNVSLEIFKTDQTVLDVLMKTRNATSLFNKMRFKSLEEANAVRGLNDGFPKLIERLRESNTSIKNSNLKLT